MVAYTKIAWEEIHANSLVPDAIPNAARFVNALPELAVVTESYVVCF